MSLRIHMPDTLRPQSRGTWQNVRWRPHPSTGEVLNVGVVFHEETGRVHVRVLESFERLKCMYGSGISSQARFLMQVIKEAVAAKVEIPSPNAFFSEKKFASGQSPDEVVNALFEATVPLGAPKGGKKEVGANVLADTASVRKVVLDHLREIGGLRANLIISSEGALAVPSEGRTHFLDIPLQTSQALGTIVSAGAARPTDELQLLRADADLHIARSVFQSDKMYMYVVRSEREANPEKVDEFLDGFRWRLSQLNVQMKSYTKPNLVAEDILEDMSA
ncbi:DUF3037 domain-containing protein [Lysobacter soli]|uniref:DUF3037 domain-containing protein n=1 Tax=Lysobacter soli TaxID=453783 RepID=UPI0024104517|nr:DUF3037 domain-containing protein [Lysobacter soli]MDG2517204.1 DUF3037 domain-containing protein [Lysobacter soli]